MSRVISTIPPSSYLDNQGKWNLLDQQAKEEEFIFNNSMLQYPATASTVILSMNKIIFLVHLPLKL
jgi:hypothetical protein